MTTATKTAEAIKPRSAQESAVLEAAVKVKEEREQKRKAYLEALNKSGSLRRQLIALCWSHVEARKNFSPGEDEWTSTDQLVSNICHDLENSIDALIHDVSDAVQTTKRLQVNFCTCDD